MIEDEVEEDGEISLVSDGEKLRLDAWLAKHISELSRSRIQALLADGSVLVNGSVATQKMRPKAGDVLTIILPPPVAAEPAIENIPLDIVYEDEDIILVNKQANLVVHPAPGHYTGTLVNGLLYHCSFLRGIGGEMRPGIVHRLDKDTTGLLVVAKHEAALASLAEQFQTGKTEKHYYALVHGVPAREADTIKSTIGRHPQDRKKMAVNPPRGKEAITHYKIVRRLDKMTLLSVKIDTGRTHQIRVHLSHLGLPIVGDQVYGKRQLDNKILNCPTRQMLHAYRFSFLHPKSGVRMEFTAPLPSDMASLLGDTNGL